MKISTDFDISDDSLALCDVIFLDISRETVETGLTGGITSKLLILSENRHWVEKFEGNVVFFFSGYDQDPRELCEVPEVVSFSRTLFREWPYLFHFSVRSDDALAALLRILTTPVVHRHNGKVGFEYNARALKFEVFAQFHGLNCLHEAFNLDPVLNYRITEEINQMLTRMLPYE